MNKSVIKELTEALNLAKLKAARYPSASYADGIVVGLERALNIVKNSNLKDI